MRQRGFTLLEVLVATMVMAIAVSGLLGALSSSMRNAAPSTTATTPIRAWASPRRSIRSHMRRSLARWPGRA